MSKNFLILIGFFILLICCKKDKNELISIDFNGKKIYVHPTDNSDGIQWGCYEGIDTHYAISETDGKANTNAIINSHNEINYANNPTQCNEDNDGKIAAKICSELNYLGYADWYLPSKDELDALFNNKESIGGFNPGLYWSSTEAIAYNDDFTWLQDFSSGQKMGLNKNASARVRCIRRE